jgi:hypothetical protein
MEAPEWVVGTLCWALLILILAWLALLRPLLYRTP